MRPITRVTWLLGPALVLGLAAEAVWAQGGQGGGVPAAFVRQDLVQEAENPWQLLFMRMPGLSPDYAVGPGDELSVVVVGLPQDPYQLKIGATGLVTIPLLGEVDLGGLTVEEIETTLVDRFRDQDLLRDPQVLVSITRYESKTVYALGEVDNPGEYNFSFETSLMDLIFMVGGLDFTAARYGFLHRRVGTEAPDWRPTYVDVDPDALAEDPEEAAPGTEVIRVDLQPLKEGGVLERNLLLQEGDVFYVPRRKVRMLYVIGDVVFPGGFEIPEEQALTAAQAISWAGGLNKTAQAQNGVLVRQVEGRGRTELPVDFSALLEGGQPDFEVQSNDVIYIPTSNAKELGYGLLNIVPRLLLYGWIF